MKVLLVLAVMTATCGQAHAAAVKYESLGKYVKIAEIDPSVVLPVAPRPSSTWTVVTGANVPLSTSQTGTANTPNLYVSLSGTDTGSWKACLGQSNVVYDVYITVGGGKSATLAIFTTATITGTGVPDNATHGNQVGVNIVQSGAYSVPSANLGQFVMLAIIDNNGATVSAGSVRRQF